MKSKLLRFVWQLFRAVLIGYTVVLGMLVWFERNLIYPKPDAGRADWSTSPVKHEDVWLTAADGTKLHGWYMAAQPASAAVVYFHGNGEDVLACGPELASLRDSLAVSILVVDYRGYGKSEGTPNEADIVADGVMAARWLAERESIAADQLVLWGRSLGGGVAAGVSESIQPRAIILECTFDSLVNVAAGRFRWAPVRWLMRNRYPSADRLANYSGQVIQWHGGADPVVPLALAERLFAAIGGEQKQFILAAKSGHNDPAPDQFKRAVNALLKPAAPLR